MDAEPDDGQEREGRPLFSISSLLPPALGVVPPSLPPASVSVAALVTTTTLHEVHLQRIQGGRRGVV